MRLMHISDVHLGRRPDVGFPWSTERGEELWSTFAALIRECVRQQADLLLIAGELFDGCPSVDELERADRLLGAASNVEVVIAAGSADHLREGSAYADYEWSPNVHFLKSDEPRSIYLETLDTTVHGVSYSTPVRRDRILEDFTPDDEGEIQLMIAYGGDRDHCPFDLKRLQRAEFDYVALGGRHSAKLLPPGNIGYPGTPEPLSAKETGKHGYLFGEIGREKSRFTFVPFSLREYVGLTARVDAKTRQEELTGRLKQAVKSCGEQNIYRITVEGTYPPGSPFDLEQLRQIGRVCEVIDKTHPSYDIDEILDSHRDDIVGMYVEELMRKPATEETKRALYRGLDALLQEGYK